MDDDFLKGVLVGIGFGALIFTDTGRRLLGLGGKATARAVGRGISRIEERYKL